MKTIILAYTFVTLLILALFSVLSYGYDVGYVYVFWRDFQLQTNLWVVLCFLALFSLTIHLAWLFIKHYFNREKRKQQTVVQFQTLHPYEKLAVIWLLDAVEEQQQLIQQVFKPSGLLQGVMDAQILTLQGQYTQALEALNRSNVMAFELAELERIQIHLLANEPELALTHLEFLAQHPLSPWLIELQTAYENKLNQLWVLFASKYPWLYLKAAYSHSLLPTDQLKWLSQILTEYKQANQDDLTRLLDYFNAQKQPITEDNYEINIIWLKILSHFESMKMQLEQLSTDLLELKFNQDVFYLWFQQQWLKSNRDYILIEQYVNKLESKYTALPILNFVKWYVFANTDRKEQANQLLEPYPNNVFMNYLRVKVALNNQTDLIAQLRFIFENNPNFLDIKF